MITLIEAKSHLRMDHDDEDDDITRKLRLASAIINDFIGLTINLELVYEDFASDAEYEAACTKAELRQNVIDAATLLALGELYTNREALADPLSPSVKMILERLRVPSFA